MNNPLPEKLSDTNIDNFRIDSDGDVEISSSEYDIYLTIEDIKNLAEYYGLI